MLSKPKILAAAVLLSLAPLAGAQGTTGTTTTPPPTTTTTTAGVPANRIAGLFASFFGSRESALAAVNALRTGSAITLVTAPPCPAPCTTPPTGVETTIDNATRPMGWGNVRHALALAQYSLAQAGITKPTPEQIAAALNGGTVTTDAGKAVELKGILTMRAGGMGWGQIAKAEGTSMGRVNQSIKPFKGVTTAAAPTPGTTPTTAASPAAPKNVRVTTGASASAGVVTAGGGHGSGHSQAGRGIVTGNGGAVAGLSTGGGRGNGNGSGNASGGGHSSGHGNGHGHVAGTGVTTAANTAASTTITTAQGGGNGHGNGKGNGNGNGNGKGGGK